MAHLPDLLLAMELGPQSLLRLQEVCNVNSAFTADERAALAAERGESIRAILTNGTTLIPSSLLSALPNLGIICTLGAGYEGIDLKALASRDVVVANGPGTNNNSVADHAVALMLAVLRDIPGNDAFVRAGHWRRGDTMRPGAHGRRLGILGLGAVGRIIAKRCSGFDMQIAYHNRRPLPNAEWRYVTTLLQLAEESDILIVALPGGPATRHIVGPAVLDALGPQGVLVNVGRGSVVDTNSLIDALRERRITGAGLDVVEGEPNLPEELLKLSNVVLSPHIAGRSPEAVSATIEMVIANLTAHFAGLPVLTPIPEIPAIRRA